VDSSEGRTQRLRIEEALAESEQKFRAVFDQATMGIALGNLAGRCLRANKAACDFIGATETEVCRLSIQDIVHPDDLGMTKDIFPRLVAGVIPYYTVERRYVRRDKTIVWGRARVSVIRDAEGKPSYLVGVMENVTREKLVEKQRAALSRLGHGLSGVATRDQAARVILDVASELFGWDSGYVHLYSEKTGEFRRVLTMDTIKGQRVTVPAAMLTLEPSPMMRKVMMEGAQLLNRATDSAATTELIPFGNKRHRSASLMFVPVRSGGAAVGILSIQSYTPEAYTRDDLGLLQTLADLCGDALERIRVSEALREALTHSHEELERVVNERTAELEAVNQTLRDEIANRKRLEQQVLEGVQREQERIGQDLHDGLCQLLTGIKFKSVALGSALRRKGLPEADETNAIEVLVNQAICQGYGLARGLNPMILPGHGLTLALKELAASVEAAFNVSCFCNFRPPLTLDEPTVANHFYRIAQEAIHNAIKHGKASVINLTLTTQSGEIELTIQDNGVGLPADCKTGMGLQNMKARAGLMGAALDIRTGATGGTVVACLLKIPTLRPRSG
jgi:PAS domain S-box-containing protein